MQSLTTQQLAQITGGAFAASAAGHFSTSGVNGAGGFGYGNATAGSSAESGAQHSASDSHAHDVSSATVPSIKVKPNTNSGKK